jgi:hypothetical protein
MHIMLPLSIKQLMVYKKNIVCKVTSTESVFSDMNLK